MAPSEPVEPPEPEEPAEPEVQAPIHERVFRFVESVVRGLFVHHAFDHAASMAFYFFLGMIPLLVAVGLLVGTVVQREGVESIAAPLYRAMPKVASDFFHDELRQIADAGATTLAPLSALGFLWLTTNAVHNLMDVFETLVKAPARPWWRQRAIALAWVAGGLVVLVALTWIILLLNGAASGLSALNLPSLLRDLNSFFARGWQRFGVLVLFLGVASLGLAAFYRTSVAHAREIRRRVWVGTFVALALWFFVSWAFGTYVASIARYAVFYGSLATVAILLLWLYLTSLALLVGAEVNARLEGVRDRP